MPGNSPPPFIRVIKSLHAPWTAAPTPQLERAHALFLNTLMVQSFLTVRTMCINLTEIFQDVAVSGRRLSGWADG